MNLKVKIILFISIISVIPIFLMGKISYHLGIKSTIEYKQEIYYNMLEKIKKNIEKEVEGIFSNIEYFEKEFKNKSEEELITIMKTILDTQKNYKKIYFVNEEEKIYFSIPVEQENIILKNQSWYILAKRNNIAVSTPHPLNPILKITKAVKDNNGKLIGMIGIDYNMEEVLKEVSSTKIGDEGYLHIVNSEGIPVLYPVDRDISISMDIKKKILNEKSGMINYMWNKKEKFTAYDEVKILNWIIIGETYMSDLKKSLENVKNVNNYIMYFILIAALLMIFIFIKYMLNKIGHIINFSNEMANGNYSNLYEKNKKDEFGKIMEGFNSISIKQSSILSTIKNEAFDLEKASGTIKIISGIMKESTGLVSRNIKNLQSGMDENVSSVEEASINLRNISNHSQNITKMTEDLKIKIKNANEKTAKLKEYFEKIDKIMENIKNKAEETLESVKILNKELSNIHDFNNTIKQISKRTNMLAFNVAIDAAKTADKNSAKSLKILSDEIRLLAEKVNDLTEGIEKKVSIITQKSNMVELKIKEEFEEIIKGKNSIMNIGKEVIGIAEEIEKTAYFVENVEESAKIQENMTKEINSAIEKISFNIQESQMKIEEIFIEISGQFNTAEELEEMSKELNNTTKRLNDKVKGYKILGEEKNVEIFEEKGIKLMNFE